MTNKTFRKKILIDNKICMQEKANTISAIRFCSELDYNNRAADHSDEELYEIYRLYCNAGLKPIHAMEASAFTLKKYTAQNPPDQAIIDGLKMIKGGY